MTERHPADRPAGDAGLPPERRTLTRGEIIAHFELVETFLPTGHTFEITAVGGAPLVLLGLRGEEGSTADVDAITDLPPQLEEAATRAALESGLPATWINTRAKAFSVNDPRPSIVVYRSRNLTVRSAAADDIFIMKMYAAASGGRGERDRGDLVALWSRCSYRSPQEAVNDYLARVPLAEGNDPYLVDWIADIVAEARGHE